MPAGLTSPPPLTLSLCLHFVCPAVLAAGRADEVPPGCGPSQASWDQSPGVGLGGPVAEPTCSPSLPWPWAVSQQQSPASQDGGEGGSPSTAQSKSHRNSQSLWTHCTDEETEAQKAVTCLTSVGGEGSTCLPGPGPPSPRSGAPHPLSSAVPSPAVLRAWKMTRNQECGQPPGAGRSCREHVS